MKRLEFNDFEDFAYSVSKMFQDVIESSIYNDIAIIAKYEESRQIIKYLIQIGYDMHNINLNCKESNMYDDEYIVSLCKFDDEECIWCEPLKNEDGYLTDNSTVAYVLDNCSSKLLKHLDSKCIFEVGICEDDEDCDECNKCKCDDLYFDEDDDTHGFTVTTSDKNGTYSYSFYSTDEELVREKAKLFK